MQPNMTQTAQAIQAQGRGNDSMLMHMTPREVGGLQALAMAHGGSLTINPKTGLPEAGFLENILPTLLGVGLSFIPGVGPMMAAGLVGGGTALATGDIGKGLMAGLGAFGGAGMGSALGAAGGASAAGSALPSAAGSALPSAAGPTVTLPGSGDVSLLSSFSGPQAGTTTAGLIDGGLSATGGSGVSAGLPAKTFTSNAAQAGRGFQDMFSSGQTGEAARSAFMKDIGGVPGAIRTGLGVAASIPPPTQQAPKEETGEVPQYTKSREGPMFPGADRSPTDSSEFRYFGPSQYTRTGTVKNPLTASSSGAGDPMALLSSLSDEERQRLGLAPLGMKQGGLAALARGRRETRKSMPPRFLAGGGDGMSDSIPAVINGNQPARLADGEFVVPADVVSHLGNGSSKAGAKKLYAMMDRVRKARTGKKRQAPEINMNRMMPA
jgi:hypothetical protein